MGTSTGKWSDQYKDPRWQKKRQIRHDIMRDILTAVTQVL